jgi:hypothetical protein
MAELKIWSNDFDIIIAESAEEALRILEASEHYDGDLNDDEQEFHLYAHETITWQEECGYSEGVKLTPKQLIAKLGKGYAGITEC